MIRQPARTAPSATAWFPVINSLLDGATLGSCMASPSGIWARAAA
jgi:hypothetical protein